MKQQVILTCGTCLALVMGILGCANWHTEREKNTAPAEIGIAQTPSAIESQLSAIKKYMHERGITQEAIKGDLSRFDMVQDLLKTDYGHMPIANIEEGCSCLGEAVITRLSAIEEAMLVWQKATLKNGDGGLQFFIAQIGWATTVVIGLAGLSLGWSVYRTLVDSRRILRQAEDKLKQDFNPWVSKRRGELDEQFKKLAEICDQGGYFVRLMVLTSSPCPKKEDVFGLLTPLTERPKVEYVGLFRDILKLQLGEEIDSRIKNALTKLRSIVGSRSSTVTPGEHKRMADKDAF